MKTLTRRQIHTSLEQWQHCRKKSHDLDLDGAAEYIRLLIDKDIKEESEQNGKLKLGRSNQGSRSQTR